MINDFLILLYKGCFRAVWPIVRWYKLPAWVRDFPYEADRAGLTQVALNTKGRLHTPREMVYVLSDVRGKKAVENAVYTIEQEGWHCTVLPQQGMPGTCVIESKKDDYELTEENYMHDCAFFNRVARLYGAESDGWYAGGEPPLKQSTRRYLRYGLIGLFILLSLSIRGFIVLQIVSDSPAPAQAAAATPGSIAFSDNITADLSKVSVKHGVAADTNYVPLDSADLGVSMRYPDNWMVVVTQACATDGTLPGTAECQSQFYLKNWQDRYVPTITVQRVTGNLDDVQKYQERMYAMMQLQDPTIQIIKDHISLDGHPGVRYTQTSNGTKKVNVYVQNGDKVFGILGETPKSSPADLDYFQVFNTMVASVKPRR